MVEYSLMRNSLFLSILVIFLLLIPQLSSAEIKYSVKNTNQHFCKNEELGLSYFCSPQWKSRVINDAVLVIISSDPAVTMTITKIDSKIVFLPQITKDFLAEKDLYDENFRLKWKTLGKKDAIQVKAFSKKQANRRLLDYYFMHNSELYAVLFSVHPKEQWDEYKFLIKEIGESFQFIEKSIKKASNE